MRQWLDIAFQRINSFGSAKTHSYAPGVQCQSSMSKTMHYLAVGRSAIQQNNNLKINNHL